MVLKVRKEEAERVRKLIERYGGTYSSSLGIDLSIKEPIQVFRWFLASLLFGARIGQKIAIKTYGEFVKRGLDNPVAIVDSGIHDLIKAEGRGGYARYDYRTATKIIGATETVIDKYNGNLNELERSATGPRDLESKLIEFKGVGPTTVGIFLREMRDIWEKADPPLGDLAISAAKDLKLVPLELMDETEILKALKFLWEKSRIEGKRFADFESALVRYGIENRKKLEAK